MRKERESFSSYRQSEADALLAKLGAVEAGAVKRKVDSLNAWARDEPVMREWSGGDWLAEFTSCSHEFSSQAIGVVPRIINELADFPPAALLEGLTNTDDMLTLHLVSRALARADAEMLTAPPRAEVGRVRDRRALRGEWKAQDQPRR